MNHKHLAAFSGVMTVAGLSILAAWGPLDPPNGPIAPTYKTLTDVEPRIALSAENTPGDADSVFRISAAGSYYLAGPLSVPSGKSGIEVAVSNVTLDLSGYRLIGQNGSLDGIHVNFALYGVTICNGAIAATKGDGIDASDSTGLRIERVTVTGVAGQGIVVGKSNEIERCIVRNSGSQGINTGDSCRVSGCTTEGNGGVGIDVDDNGSVRDCIASGNAASGFGANDGCTFSGCAAASNTTDGFLLAASATVTGCTARDNLENGFTASESAVLTDCQAGGNAVFGFELVARGRATRCIARDNDQGFRLKEGNSVIECTAASNRHGIAINGDANTVERSSAHENDTMGIYLFAGAGNNIDGNFTTRNGEYGIQLLTPDNLLVRNRSWANTLGNYLVVQDNHYAAILKDPGEGFNSSAPWTNFGY